MMGVSQRVNGRCSGIRDHCRCFFIPSIITVGLPLSNVTHPRVNGVRHQTNSMDLVTHLPPVW